MILPLPSTAQGPQNQDNSLQNSLQNIPPSFCRTLVEVPITSHHLQEVLCAFCLDQVQILILPDEVYLYGAVHISLRLQSHPPPHPSTHPTYQKQKSSHSSPYAKLFTVLCFLQIIFPLPITCMILAT